MSQNTEARMHPLQPPLPLVEPEAAPDASPSTAEADWHLDEHTREVGRRGIAAARARLRDRAGATHRTDGVPPPATDGPHHAPGRAA